MSEQSGEIVSPDGQFRWDGKAWQGVTPPPDQGVVSGGTITPAHGRPSHAGIPLHRNGAWRSTAYGWSAGHRAALTVTAAIAAVTAGYLGYQLHGSGSHPPMTLDASSQGPAPAAQSSLVSKPKTPNEPRTPAPAAPTATPTTDGNASTVAPSPPTPSATAAASKDPVYTLTGLIDVNSAYARTVTYSPPDNIFTNFDHPTCTSKRADITVGTVITVRNESGTIIGTGAVSSSQWINLSTISDPGLSDGGVPGAGVPASTSRIGDCVLHLTVQGLPPASFYTVQIGATSQNISLAAMQGSGWSLSMDLRVSES